MNLADVLSRMVRSSDSILWYGDGPEHLVELWFPEGKPPLRSVVVIHGGFWSAEYDRTHIRSLCAELAKLGYLTAALEYHRVGQERGGWPGTFHDIADGLDALPSLTDGLIRPDHTVLLGHSAGGHLALWAALRHRLPAGSPGHRTDLPRFSGVVSLAGVCDLAAGYRLDLDVGAVDRLLGGSPLKLPHRYRIADPAELLPLGTRCVLVHGGDDDRVPFEISRRFHDLAAAHGDDIVLTRLAGTGHFELIEPGSAAFPAVVQAIDTVFGPAGSQ
jgi:acetyl esterase/lipase